MARDNRKALCDGCHARPWDFACSNRPRPTAVRLCNECLRAIVDAYRFPRFARQCGRCNTLGVIAVAHDVARFGVCTKCLRVLMRNWSRGRLPQNS